MQSITLRQSNITSDKSLFYLFLVLLAWLPLPLGSNRLWSISIMEICTLSLALMWLVQYLRGRVMVSDAFARAWPVVLCLALLVCWVELQSIPLPLPWLEMLSPGAHAIQEITNSHPSLSVNVHATQFAALKTLTYALLFCLTLLLVNSRARLKMLALVIVFSGLFQAAYGSFMTLSGMEYGFFAEKYAGRGNATGTFINRNHLAGYLEMSLAIGIGLMLGEIATRNAVNWRDSARRLLRSLLGRKMLVRLALAIMVIGLVLTHSRMGNSAFFVSLTITGLLYLLATRKRVTRGTLIFFVSLLAIDLLIVGNFFGMEKVVDRLQGTSMATEQRDEVTRDSIAIIKDYPLAGTGAGSYYSVFPLYSSPEIRSTYDHAHNDYVEFASEFGLVGFSLLVMIVVLALKSAITALLTRRDPLMRGMGFAGVMGIIALLIHSAVDFNLQIPANAALFMVVLALAVMSRDFERG